MCVALSQASCTVQVPTLDGSEPLEVRPGTQPMSERVMPQRGVPNVRGRGRGDLVVRLVVQVPKKLDDEAKELVEKLAGHLPCPRGDGNCAQPGEREEESVFSRVFSRKKKKQGS